MDTKQFILNQTMHLALKLGASQEMAQRAGIEAQSDYEVGRYDGKLSNLIEKKAKQAKDLTPRR